MDCLPYFLDIFIRQKLSKVQCSHLRNARIDDLDNFNFGRGLGLGMVTLRHFMEFDMGSVW